MKLLQVYNQYRSLFNGEEAVVDLTASLVEEQGGSASSADEIQPWPRFVVDQKDERLLERHLQPRCVLRNGASSPRGTPGHCSCP